MWNRKKKLIAELRADILLIERAGESYLGQAGRAAEAFNNLYDRSEGVPNKELDFIIRHLMSLQKNRGIGVDMTRVAELIEYVEGLR